MRTYLNRTELALFRVLSADETEWRKKNNITCKRCLYGCGQKTDPKCDYILITGKAKRCTGLTCIQRGVFKPSTPRVNVEKVKRSFYEWVREHINGRPALENMWAMLNDGRNGFVCESELSCGGTGERAAGSDKEGMQERKVYEET